MKKRNVRSLISAFSLLFTICWSNNFALAHQKCASIFYNTLNSQNETLRFHSPDNFITGFLKVFKKTSVDDIEFVGQPLSKVQFQALARFISRAGRSLQKGDSIRIVSQSELLKEVRTSVGHQVIQRNGSFENRLIKESSIDEKPKEVLTFRLHYEDGKIEETPILIRGDLNSVNFSQGELELFNYLGGNFSGIRTVEIAHTHPTYVVLITSKDGTTQFRANEISEDDMRATVEFARRFPRGMEIVMKAIVPNGFNYSGAVATGR